MSSLRRVFVALSTVAILSGGVVVATASSVSDPNESAATSRDIRIAKLARPSSSTFVWTIKTWDTFRSADVSPLGFTLYLDTRGGTANDRVVTILWNSFYDSLECQVEKPSGTSLATGTTTRPDSRSVVCRFPKSALDLQKTIRWRAASENVGYTDFAPDPGYVKGV